MEITQVKQDKNSIIVEYIINDIIISTRVFDYEILTPQQIVEKGFNELRPHLQIECDRLGIELDTEVPLVTDEIITLELLNVNNLKVHEGDEISFNYMLRSLSKFGKHEIVDCDITSTLELPITKSSVETVIATYGDLKVEKTFNINYIPYVEPVEEPIIEMPIQNQIGIKIGDDIFTYESAIEYLVEQLALEKAAGLDRDEIIAEMLEVN